MSGKKRSLCPACGKHASGNFCHHCGAALGGQFCNQCGSEITGEGKFCNQCGATVKGAGPRAGAGASGGGGGAKRGGAKRGGGASRQPDAGPTNTLPWWFAGAAMFIVILVVGWNMTQSAGPAAPAGGGAPAGAVNPNAPGTTDISQMSPREAADRLFNRVMGAAESGDTVTAQGFMPMAIQAYELAQPLDMDGLFHLSLLQNTGRQSDRALATAQQMLENDPNHILGLSAAASAAVELEMLDEAEAYYRRILDNIDTEMTRALPEYEGHRGTFQVARTEAEAFLVGR